MKDLPVNQVINGDSAVVLSTFPENSIDCIVTDPPYGMSFMGFEWDKALPPKKVFLEMCRVLKPGGLAFVMSSPRQDLMWRMAQLLEESGFKLELSFICWIYNNGFPKAYDVSRGIDKKFGLEREVIGVIDRTSAYNEVGYSGGVRGYEPTSFDVTKPNSPEAKKYDGHKAVSGLKPSHEVIFMVQKPLSEKSIVDNVLKHGTGSINVDACRIPIEDEVISSTVNSPEKATVYGKYNQVMYVSDIDGRFPPNLLVSDNALDTDKKDDTNTVSDGVYSMSRSRFFNLDVWGKHKGYFVVPKPSTGERDRGLIGEKESVKNFFSADKETGERFDGNTNLPRINTHPTVKPVLLGAYLCELGCPPDGIVLDPFCGSGSFLISAASMGKKYIGVELSPEFHKLSEDRLSIDLSYYRKIMPKIVRKEENTLPPADW